MLNWSVQFQGSRSEAEKKVLNIRECVLNWPQLYHRVILSVSLSQRGHVAERKGGKNLSIDIYCPLFVLHSQVKCACLSGSWGIWYLSSSNVEASEWRYTHRYEARCHLGILTDIRDQYQVSLWTTGLLRQWQQQQRPCSRTMELQALPRATSARKQGNYVDLG